MQENEETFVLPASLRKGLSVYIQTNPSPNQNVEVPLSLIMGLQNLTSMKKTTAIPPTLGVVPDEDEDWVVAGGVEESKEESDDNG